MYRGIKKRLPSADLLNEFLTYDPATGSLTWKRRDLRHFSGTPGRSAEHCCNFWNSKHAGKPAGQITTGRYAAVHIFRERFYVQRVVWKMVYGSEPDCIDHINGDGFDNRLANLRDVSHAANMRNMKVRTDNSSGRTGVRYHPGRDRWEARYSDRSLGWFETFEDAVSAREAEERRLSHRMRSDRSIAVA